MSKLQHSWILAAACVLLLVTGLHAQPTEQGTIVLARVTGTVTLEDNQTRIQRPASDRDQITGGTTVITSEGASVILVFSNGSTINLGSDSALNIEEYLQDPFSTPISPASMTEEPTTSVTNLELTRGELVGEVKRLNRDRGSSFTVRTPAGAAGIRGTVFRIVYRPSGTGQAFFSLTTVEGEVGFSTTGTVDAPQALVGENQEVTVEVSVDPTTGTVTVLTPVADIVPQAASASGIAAATAAVQQVVEAVVDVVLTSTGSAPAGGSPPSGTTRNAPEMPRNNPETTPGDGRSG